MMSERTYRGDSAHAAFDGSPRVAHPLRARVWSFSAGSGTSFIRLPDARTCRRGAVQLVLINQAGASVQVRDAGDNTLITLSSTQGCIVGLLDNSTVNGSWRFLTRTYSAS